MSNHQVSSPAHTLRRAEIARLVTKAYTWLGTELRIRHEAALRRRSRNVRMRSVNPTPV
ncbi:MAG: hypothetical protein ABI905_15820 [Betaproteobacteria bacterium]